MIGEALQAAARQGLTGENSAFAIVRNVTTGGVRFDLEIPISIPIPIIPPFWIEWVEITRIRIPAAWLGAIVLDVLKMATPFGPLLDTIDVTAKSLQGTLATIDMLKSAAAAQTTDARLVRDQLQLQLDATFVAEPIRIQFAVEGHDDVLDKSHVYTFETSCRLTCTITGVNASYFTPFTFDAGTTSSTVPARVEVRCGAVRVAASALERVALSPTAWRLVLPLTTESSGPPAIAVSPGLTVVSCVIADGHEGGGATAASASIVLSRAPETVDWLGFGAVGGLSGSRPDGLLTLARLTGGTLALVTLRMSTGGGEARQVFPMAVRDLGLDSTSAVIAVGAFRRATAHDLLVRRGNRLCLLPADRDDPNFLEVDLDAGLPLDLSLTSAVFAVGRFNQVLGAGSPAREGPQLAVFDRTGFGCRLAILAFSDESPFVEVLAAEHWSNQSPFDGFERGGTLLTLQRSHGSDALVLVDPIGGEVVMVRPSPDGGAVARATNTSLASAAAASNAPCRVVRLREAGGEVDRLGITTSSPGGGALLVFDVKDDAVLEQIAEHHDDTGLLAEPSTLLESADLLSHGGLQLFACSAGDGSRRAAIFELELSRRLRRPAITTVHTAVWCSFQDNSLPSASELPRRPDAGLRAVLDLLLAPEPTRTDASIAATYLLL